VVALVVECGLVGRPLQSGGQEGDGQEGEEQEEAEDDDATARQTQAASEISLRSEQRKKILLKKMN